MPRRRYRLFTACAVIIVFLLYRVAQNSWDQQPPASSRLKAPSHDSKSQPQSQWQQPIQDQQSPQNPPGGETNRIAHDIPEPPQEPLAQDAKTPPAVVDKPTRPAPIQKDTTSQDDDAKVEIPVLKEQGGKGTAPRPTGIVKDPSGGTGSRPVDSTTTSDSTRLKWKNPPKSDWQDVQKAQPGLGDVHWIKQPQNFPVPDESIIALPTGSPKQIPKIQYDFAAESEEAKTKRLHRQSEVKAELARSWSGYRKHAWMHDELRPVSAKLRDPFCGWAATLVDALDTLWIAGMKTEFDEAAKAVKNIDFTITPRADIPVFETVIRYLGGLLGAFDVSGGHEGGYTMLLDKAVELAEILIGVFDTPNRMPILFYNWLPNYVSQPHRAGRAGMAELATLSLEFTRLAQITKENKYYDAVARITDALIEMQESGTAIPGLFPENLDVSGCNRTATAIRDAVSKDAQRQLDSQEVLDAPVGYTGSGKSRPVVKDDELEVRPGSSAASKDSTLEKRAMEKVFQKNPPFTASGQTSEWDCVPQGIIPGGYGYQSYHMGGGQDSAYEYFPKEYLLLGGLEPKYKKLHVDTIKAINEWLLYRPMAKDSPDVLFPAKVTTSGDPKRDLTPLYEITHLTCFIGGMYGMGGKIFGRPEDVEMAKKLTEGCVWAYSLTASGLMPEAAHVLACPTLEKCEFNETLWWDKLDPSREWRGTELALWEENQKKELQAKKESETKKAGNAPVEEIKRETETKSEASELQDNALEHRSHSSHNSSSSSTTSGSLRKRAAIAIEDKQKAAATAVPGSELPQSLKDKLNPAKEEAPIKDAASAESKAPTKTSKVDVAKEKTPSVPEFQPWNNHVTYQPSKPQTHKEYVKDKIEKDVLPSGFVSIPGKSYILRPEAIESVWYMYRITGDPSWMEKGWTMFQATVRATRTELANSAVDDVTLEKPRFKDEMESFWLAETLKYYYLLFSGPDVISLDEWVLNTEAHPFRRPT